MDYVRRNSSNIQYMCASINASIVIYVHAIFLENITLSYSSKLLIGNKNSFSDAFYIHQFSSSSKDANLKGNRDCGHLDFAVQNSAITNES